MCSSLVAMWFHCRWLEKGQGKDALKWGINRQAHCSAWGESACQWSPNLFPSRSVFTPITDLISIKSPLAAAAACPPPHHTVCSPCLTDKWTRTHKPHRRVCKMEAVGFNLPGSFFMCIKGYYPQRHSCKQPHPFRGPRQGSWRSSSVSSITIWADTHLSFSTHPSIWTWHKISTRCKLQAEKQTG